MTEDSRYSMQSEASPVRMAPPTAPGRPEPRRTVWPVALGVVIFVFGVLAVLNTIWSVAAPWVLLRVAPFSASAQRAQDAMTVLGWLHYVFPIASLGLALLACLGGVRLWRRNPSGAALTRRWAIGKLLYAFAAASAGAYTQHTVMQLELASQTPVAPFSNSGLILGVAALSFVFALAWLSALPVFMLCWLASARVKPEIAGWTEPKRPGGR